MRTLYILILVLSVSCSGTKSNPSCNENMKFRTEFFRRIQNIEDAYKEDQDAWLNDDDETRYRKDMEFFGSLEFIMKYTDVSLETLVGYERYYPQDIFLRDKKGWLKWYEENRCNNIQFKE